MILFQNRTTDGTSDSFTSYANQCVLQIVGTFDGATVSIETSQDGLPFVIDASGIFTVATHQVIDTHPGMKLRAVVSNDGAGTNISVSIISKERNS